MENEKINQDIDKVFGLMESVQGFQMALLRSNIKALYEANVGTLDADIIGQQIMNLPFDGPQSREIQFKCEGCTDCKGDHKIISKDPLIDDGLRGHLQDLSYVQNASVIGESKDYYHHCPEVQDDLVRLITSALQGVYVCPVCSQEFK